ncbi:MAG: histidine kinase [Actinomycetota bacterium]|nr:histidine kinase [Actinomycetota bacterium]
MLNRLRAEVAELRASRERLVLAADADRMRIERALHDGAQQQLVGLAVNLQLAASLANSDPAAAETLMGAMAHDVQQALEQAAALADWIYAPLLEAGGLAAALRSAATRAEVPAVVDVRACSSFAPALARTVYMCWLDALEHVRDETPVKVTVREDSGALTFEVVESARLSDARLVRLRDRVEALGGRLTVGSEPGTVSGSLPLSR